MEQEKVKAKVFTPVSKKRGQNSLFNLILCFGILTLPGCVTTEEIAPLAPSPPAIDSSFFATQNQTLYQPYYFAAPTESSGNKIIESTPIKAALNAPVSPPNECRFKDKFDRKSVLAYEWGRNKLSLDIDGINLKQSSNKAIRFEYKIRLQPEKTKKQKCRFLSNWQGLIGSGYNEVFIRKDGSIEREINKLKERFLPW